MQLCLILHCKFVYMLHHKFYRIFLCVILVFLLSLSVCKFSITFHPAQAFVFFFFVFDVLKHSHNFGTNCFVFCFFHLFAMVLNANLLDVWKANPMFFITKLTVFFVGDCDICTLHAGV